MEGWAIVTDYPQRLNPSVFKVYKQSETLSFRLETTVEQKEHTSDLGLKEVKEKIIQDDYSLGYFLFFLTPMRSVFPIHGSG